MNINKDNLKRTYYGLAKKLFSEPERVSWPELAEMDKRSDWKIGRDSLMQATQIVQEVYGYNIDYYKNGDKWGCSFSKHGVKNGAFSSFLYTEMIYATKQEAFIGAMCVANNFMWGKLPRELTILPESDPGHGNISEIEFLTGGDAL